MKTTIITILAFMFAVSALADVPLSYTGRLVNLNGSPVSGPVNLKLELARTDGALPPTVLCTQTISSVPLTNGVFHLKIDFTNSQCGGIPVSKVLADTPPGEAAAIRVTDVTNSKVYSFQAIHAIPFSSVSYYAKSLAQMGAVAGQVLSWNGTQWAPASAGGSGSVSSVATGAGLTGGPITASGTISVASGGITAAMLAQMGASLGNTLKWNGSAWAPSPDAGITSESDPTVQGWAKNTILVCTTAQTLRYDALLNSGAGGLYCSNIALSSDAIAEGSTNLYYTDARAKTAAVANALADGVNDVAPSQNAVFDALALKQNTLSSSTNISVRSLQSSAVLNGSSGVEYAARIIPTVNQTSTAGYTGLLLNVTETATGSGLKKLLDLQVGGVSKFSVDSNGSVTSGTSTQGTTANYTSAGGNQFVIGYDASNKTTVNVDTLGFTTFSSTGTAAGFNFTGGNVGIGTSAPAEKLEVAGTIRSGSTGATGGSVMLVDNYTPGHLTVFGTEYSSGGPFIGYGVYPGSAAPETFVSSTPVPLARTALNAGVDFRFFTAASQTIGTGGAISLTEKMRISNFGHVGIGTKTPEAPLDVNGTQILRSDANGYGLFFPKYNTSVFGPNYDRFEIRMDPSSQIANLGTFSSGTGLPRSMGLFAGSQERLRIGSDGNVGIGTTSPNTKLEISAGSEQLRLSYDPTHRARFTVNAAGDLDITSTSGKTSFNNGMGGFELGGINNRGSLQIINRASSAWVPFATINTSYPENVYDLQNVGTINSYYIGIQQPTPAAYLDIGMRNNNSPNAVSAIFSRGADMNFQMFAGTGVDTNNVGGLIGKFGSRYSTTGDNAVINFYRGAGSVDGRIGLSTSGADRLTVRSDGNVGIGITNPTEKLEVDGTVKATNFVGNFAVKSAIIPPDNYWYRVASGVGEWCGFDYRTDTPAANSPSFSRGTIKVINDDNHMPIDVASSQYGPNTNVQFARSGNGGEPGVVWVRNLGSYDAYFTITEAKNCSVALDGTRATVPPSGSGQVIFSQLPGNSTYTNLNSITMGLMGIGTDSPTARLDVNGALHLKGKVFGDSDGTNVYLKAPTGASIYISPNDSTSHIFTSSGDLGIGTLGPSSRLHVSDSSASSSKVIAILNNQKAAANGDTAEFQFRHNNDGQPTARIFTQIVSNSDLTSKLHFGTRYDNGSGYTNTDMTIAAGRIGIGTQAPISKLHVHDVTESSLRLTSNNAAGNWGELSFTSGHSSFPNNGSSIVGYATGGHDTGGLAFKTSYGTARQTRMVISDSGRVGIATLSPLYTLDVRGDVNIGNSSRLLFNEVVVCSTTGCTSSSDKRLKKNIVALDGSLEKILSLDGYEYDFIDSKKYTDKRQIGLIAQDVEQVFPEVVNTDKKSGLKSIAYDHLVAPLIEAVKSLYTMIRGMESRLDQHDLAIASKDREIKKLREEIEHTKRENAKMNARLEALEAISLRK